MLDQVINRSEELYQPVVVDTKRNYDNELVHALNSMDFEGARAALLCLIHDTVGDRVSSDSPQYTTCPAIQGSISVDTSRDDLLTYFALDTLRDRYFLKDKHGVICETPQMFWSRVATGVACGAYSNEEITSSPTIFGEVSNFAQRLYDVLSRLHALFATPILTNAGTNRGMLISCFLNELEDSIGGIFGGFYDNAFLGRGGGGIGTYFGNLRSTNTKTSRGGRSSGPIPFLKVFDSALAAVDQAGSRRGAGAAYMPISHPDIEDFIDIRRPEGDPDRRCFNLHHGIAVTDEFMQAVEARQPFNLVDPHTQEVKKTVDALDLFKKILISRVTTGEPYMLFVDTVNRLQPEIYKEHGLEVKTSNLCIEITIPTCAPTAEKRGRTAVCDLASINAALFEEFKDDFEYVVSTMVRGLDNVLDIFIKTAGPAYEDAVYSAQMGRDIGLGVMGWFDYLQKREIPFESLEARRHNTSFFKRFASAIDQASLRLAVERGPAPEGGIYRNVNRSALAPTATIGIIAGSFPSTEGPSGNVIRQETMSGKYVVRNKYLQDILSRDYASHDNEYTWDSITNASGSVQHLEWMSEDHRKLFKTASEINQREVIQQAADRQPYITQSQSLNVFFAPGSTGKISSSYVFDVHMMAWKLGVKSLYYCRSASVLKSANTSTVKSVQAIVDHIQEQECTVCQ